MTKQHKQFIVRVLIVTIALSLVYTNLYSRILGNKGGCPYESETCEIVPVGGDFAGAAGTVTSSINTLIIEGAGSFLNSQAAALLFLNKIEMSEVTGLNYNDLRESLYRAIENMEMARNSYMNLTELAIATPYKLAVIKRLITFDYEGYQTRNGLNGDTFRKVEQYLGKGDVNGLFTEMLLGTKNLLDMLYALKE
ncbi:MAG: hypothetical protein QG657_242, partial [Acidobacteriota bacterium]|nr:hypothetical protein [Acidobacteriota bacterium]